MLDPVECERARVSRNRAYDGRFFTGVRTTGVYCRPAAAARLLSPNCKPLECFAPTKTIACSVTIERYA